MKRHLLKLMWNRKRQNALVAAEVFVSFLVLFVVSAFGVYFTTNYRKPLGFETKDIWHLEVGMHQAGGTEEENAQRYATVLTELERMPEVRRAAAIDFPPYFTGYSEWNMELRARKPVTVQSNRATEGLDEVLGLRVIAGRWFNPQDDGMNWKPVVLDRAMAEAAFGRVDVIGERAYFLQDQEEHRVVGVIENFRRGGELSPGVPYVFFRAKRDGVGDRPPQVLLAMQPGVDSSFEQTLLRRVSAVAPEWSFALKPLERERASSLRVQLMPLIIGAIVAGFLVLMVALGLTGIMWQTVTRRTRELGLRRAAGASARTLYGQIVFETVILAASGIALGLVVALQLPLMGVAAFFGTGIYFAAVLLSSGTIVALAVVCGLYPGWIASRVQPAEALRYE